VGTVAVQMSMSLDGFVAGPGVDIGHPMGRGGERLHRWLFADPQDPRDTALTAELRAGVGAVVLGRRTYDVGVGIWGDVPFPVPCFVLTHRPQHELPMASGSFTFVTGGVRDAVRSARSVAGAKTVLLMGGHTAAQVMAEGLLDELQITLVPILLGDGVRMFDRLGTEHVDLVRTRIVESAEVTHLGFRVVPASRRPPAKGRNRATIGS
jgi:dihydrofolate reductase